MRSSARGVLVDGAGALALAIVVGCGGGGTDTPTNPTPTPSITLSVAGTTPNPIVQAGSGSAIVSITRGGGFTGAVAIALENVPSGVTATLPSGSIASGTTSGSIAIDVALTVPAGTYPITVRGTGAGVSAQTATLSLVVVTRPASIVIARSASTALNGNAGGAPITFNVIVTRTEFLGDVALGIGTALPTGVTASFSPSPTSGNTIAVTLTIASSVAPGSYTANLQATGSGISPVSLAVPFTVVGAASMTVSLSRTSLSMPQNGSGVTSVTIARTNFTSAVTLTAVGVPSGVSATFGTNPTASNSTPLNFIVGPAVVPGTYQVTVTATVAGVPSAAAGMTMVITAVGTGGDYSIRFCGANDDIPIWLGFQLGNSWTRVQPGVNNTFSFNFASQGTIAWVNQRGVDDYRITVFAGARDELEVLTGAQCASPSSRTATGAVAGVGATDQVQVQFGPRASTSAPTFASPTFSFTMLPDGALDLLATRSSVESSAFVVNRLVLMRGLNPANGASVGTLDFAAGSPIVPETKTLTVTGAVGAEQLFTSSEFRTASGASITLGTNVIASGNSGVIRHVPAAQMQAGDFHFLQAGATIFSGGYLTSRSVSQTVSAPSALSLPLGAALAEPFVSVFAQSAERTRFLALIPFATEYSRLYAAGWFQQVGNTHREVLFTGTEAMVPITQGNHGTNASITQPDFSNASGFNPLWEPRNNTATTYYVSAVGWTAAGGIGAPLADGVLTKSWTRSGPVP